MRFFFFKSNLSALSLNICNFAKIDPVSEERKMKSEVSSELREAMHERTGVFVCFMFPE